MIFGVDTARYQPLGTYDPGSWECINIEDPGIAGKVERNNRDGRPSDAYVWCYSNDRNADFFRAMIRRGKELGITRFWLDYEEEGREGNWRIDIWREVCAQEQVQGGLYSNDWRIDHRLFLDLPYWYAGYPDPNDGQWKGGAPRASRPVQIWQFTSGGGLDRNVIWDEAWFANWVHGEAPAPEVPATIGDEDVTYVETKADGPHYWKLGVGDFFEIPEKVAIGEQYNGHGAPVPISTDERIVMGVKAKNQADAYFAKLLEDLPTGGAGEVTPGPSGPSGPTDAQKQAVQQVAASLSAAATSLQDAFA